VLNAEAATNPVTVIEAKGDNRDPSAADIRRGIDQAYRHLSEVNIAYVAAPIQSVTDQARALARDLNVGIIGVKTPREVTLVEPAQATGVGDLSRTVDAIRFQARSHRLTEGSFPLNHPKNYLGYALALAATDDTREVYSEHVIGDILGGRRGAILLGLVDNEGPRETLTHLGAEVVRFACDHHGSIADALETIATWRGRRTRFTELAPRWAQLARSVAMQYEPTHLIVEALEALHRAGIEPAGIDAVVRRACQINQPLAVEVCITQSRREDALTADGEIDETVLADPTVYKSGLHFQFKTHLFHVGLLTGRGTDDKDEVLDDEWALTQSVGL